VDGAPCHFLIPIFVFARVEMCQELISNSDNQMREGGR
jgi:hypothetical protein